MTNEIITEEAHAPAVSTVKAEEPLVAEAAPISSLKRPQEDAPRAQPKKLKISVTELLKNVDWWLTEPVDSAMKFQLLEDDTYDLVELTEEDWKMKLPMRTFLLPIRRYGDQEKRIVTKKNYTVREFLTFIYDFYQSKVEDDDKFDEEEMTDPENVERDVEIYLDFLTGLRDQGRTSYDSSTNHRYRHPFLCHGLVRFEGLAKIPRATAVNLGS